jgi:hypothetical protein
MGREVTMMLQFTTRHKFPPLSVRGERIEVRGRTKLALHSNLTLPSPFERERGSYKVK